MNKSKLKRILIIICVALFLILLVLFVMQISKKNDIHYDQRGRVYGTWENINYQVYLNGNMESSINNYKKLTVNFAETNIEFCYDTKVKRDCFSHSYWMENGDLVVYSFEEVNSENFETKFTYIVTDGVLEIKYGNDKDYTLTTFRKIS